MAYLVPSNLYACGLALAFGFTAVAEDDCERQELVLESGPVSFDGQANLFQLRGPRITQCGLRIEADEAVATSIDFDEQSEWRFTGNVSIRDDTAVMEADSAVFTFDKQQLARGELEGGPASFTHLDPEREKPLTGTASRMSYDYLARTLRMTDAWLQRDQTEIRGCDLIYNFTTEGIASGDADCENPFRLRVLPDPDQQDDPDPPQ